MKPAPPVTRIRTGSECNRFTFLGVAGRSVSVELVNAARAPVAASYVRSVVRRATKVPEIAARLPEHSATVAVRLTDDDELRRLHREYSGEDTVTDVLSFVGTDGHLGDLAISWPAPLPRAGQVRPPAH